MTQVAVMWTHTSWDTERPVGG